MDVNTVTNIVGSLGFPIAACCFMAYYITTQSKTHREEVTQMTTAINEMRLAIVALTENLKK